MRTLLSWRLRLPTASAPVHRRGPACCPSSHTPLPCGRVRRSSALAANAATASSSPACQHRASTSPGISARLRTGLLSVSRTYTLSPCGSTAPVAALSAASPSRVSVFLCEAHRCAAHRTAVCLDPPHKTRGGASTDSANERTSERDGTKREEVVGSEGGTVGRVPATDTGRVDCRQTESANEQGSSSSNATSNTSNDDTNSNSSSGGGGGTKSTASVASSATMSEPSSVNDTRLTIPMWRVVKMVWGYLWPERNYRIRLLVVSSVTCVLSAKCLKVVVPFWFKSIVDSLACGGVAASKVAVSGGTVAAAAATTATTATAATSPFALGVFGCVVAYGVCRISATIAEEAKTILFAPVGGHASSVLAMEMFNKLLTLDLRFHLNRETGAVSKDLDRGSRAFWTLSYALLFLIVPTIFEMGLVCFALNSQAGPQFIAIAAVSVVAYIGWTYTITNWRAKFRARYNALDSRLGGLIVDSLMNFETIKYFCTERYESARIETEVRKLNKELVKLDQSIAVLNVGQQLIFVAAGVLSLHLATSGVLSGAMTVGDLVLVDALIMQLYMPLSYLGMIYRDVQSSTQNMQSMIALLDQQSAVRESPGARPYVYRDGTIELKSVSFSYWVSPSTDTAEDATSSNSNRDDTPIDDTVAGSNAADGGDVAKGNGDGDGEHGGDGAYCRPVLRNLTLTIPGGSTVAFVGPSGSGKSTIFRLLYRFYDVTGGAILLDGQPLSRLQIESVRDAIGVIPQDSVLFNDSVRYNIRYGCQKASDAAVEQAARRASVHHAICRMSAGYDTVVGERGLKLSGGEKQRVAIARALLEDAPILLADEATSALDSSAEHAVMHTLKTSTTRRNARTIVLIAHRLTTVREADIIFVLDGHGGLAEQGTHDELLRLNGLYTLMWNQQLREKNRQAEQQETKSNAQ